MPPVQKRKKKDTPAASSGNRDIKAMFANHERRKKRKSYNVGLENICILYTGTYSSKKSIIFFLTNLASWVVFERWKRKCNN